MNTKRRAIGLGFAALAVALAIGLAHHRGSPGPRMMLIGGKNSPCTCTQRIEP